MNWGLSTTPVSQMIPFSLLFPDEESKTRQHSRRSVCSRGRLVEFVHLYSLTTLSLNEIFVDGTRIEMRRSLEKTKHRSTKGRRDGEIDEKVRGGIECDAEISDLSDRSSRKRFIDELNIENQRKKSIGQITRNETIDDKDSTVRQTRDRRSSACPRRFHSTDEINKTCVQIQKQQRRNDRANQIGRNRSEAEVEFVNVSFNASNRDEGTTS